LEYAFPPSHEGHVNSKAKTENSSNEGESESSADKGYGSESDAKRIAERVVVAGASLTFEFGPLTIARSQIRAMVDLGYFAKCDGGPLE
jgi:hypothetical protein